MGRALTKDGRPIRVLNAGVSGETAAEGLARLPAVLAPLGRHLRADLSEGRNRARGVIVDPDEVETEGGGQGAVPPTGLQRGDVLFPGRPGIALGQERDCAGDERGSIRRAR